MPTATNYDFETFTLGTSSSQISFTNLVCYRCTLPLFSISSKTISVTNLVFSISSLYGNTETEYACCTFSPVFYFTIRKPYTDTTNALITETITLDNI